MIYPNIFGIWIGENAVVGLTEEFRIAAPSLRTVTGIGQLRK